MIGKRLEIICNTPERDNVVGIIQGIDCEKKEILIERLSFNEGTWQPNGLTISVKICEIKVCIEFNGGKCSLTELLKQVSEYCSDKNP